jgi:hypothetical protein
MRDSISIQLAGKVKQENEARIKKYFNLCLLVEITVSNAVSPFHIDTVEHFMLGTPWLTAN